MDGPKESNDNTFGYKNGYLGFPAYPPEFLADSHPSGFFEALCSSKAKCPISEAVLKARSEYGPEIEATVDKINARFAKFNSKLKLLQQGNYVPLWFIYWANTHGVDDAWARLQQLVDEDEFAIRVCCDLVGINYQKPGIQISAAERTLSIESVLAHPSSFTFSNYILYPDPSMELGYYPNQSVSFVKRVKLEELAKVLKSLPRENLWNEDFDLINAFCMSATLNGHGQVSPEVTTWLIDALPCFAVFRSPLKFRNTKAARTRGDGFGIEARSIEELQENIASILQLKPANRKRIALAMRQLSLAKGEASIEEKYLYSGSALEIALGADRNQIAFSVRLFGALIAANTPEDRTELFKKLKLIYDQRSNVAHSGKVDFKKVRRAQDPAEISSKVIKEYIKLGMPDVAEHILKLGLKD